MKKKKSTGGIVFSTDPGFKIESEPEQGAETLPPKLQKLSVRLDMKQRAGKAVTLVEGFTGSDTDLEKMGKELKAFCGTGGSVKNAGIIIQGDQREKVLLWLIKHGYSAAKKI